MPIKGQSPKEVMHTEMSKFKQGTLHSGSRKGPTVKNRKQAIAIGLSESGQSKYDRSSHHEGNPGFNRSEKVKSPSPLTHLPPKQSAVGSGQHANIPASSHEQRTKVTFNPGGNCLNRGSGNSGTPFRGTNKSGVLRVSGAQGAHQVGKRSR